MEINQLYQIFLQSKGVATDTRSIQTKQLFFALKGDNFNGNLFAEQAVAKSQYYAVVDDEELAKDDRYILVSNTLETLATLANYHRNQLGIPILAITGSNGKTTTKELIHAVLRRKFETVATLGNLNNHIGVPLTLFSMKETTEFGIVEMGANRPKEIEALCKIANPDFGYITNFGKAHLEGFGSIEGVIKAKSELYTYLKDNSKLLFLNLDDPIQKKQLAYKNTFSFGSAPDADMQVNYSNNSQTAQVVVKDTLYTSLLTGNYNAINIAAAISVGHYFKVPKEAIKKAIAGYTPKNNRSQIIKLGKTSLLMDAYNANPTSMTAALNSFNKYAAVNKTVILGDMFELGTSAAEEHQNIANLALDMDFEQIYLVGENFNQVKNTDNRIRKFSKFSELEQTLIDTDLSNRFILIKGSRGMALERIVEVLKRKEA
ncbi:UDP-N-acetylmuramoyl-tripeptide--D-alanyl-D-alanine ligase [Gillisia sp. M10.2A]|uniref:UDP-N-acetylmuramoyl-tripeptide--D-alanyl-D-alanine ligase n=1 Tax=Gillisia lutea TaxID=2909668 RepID=A0ABS9EH66_9FLAO|nr:UDP-N-acetylmuramoyl-tripeptide--D-alanyl-D-alanine ligase [Gillisia lutea]MCF4102218.1 UDP-N-acetylmuramoyl-tripeptide--D-alanyl-D-alanine ligase [Gillisia lutea]